jgi:hypothetical protein
MAKSSWSGPINSENGFMQPVLYITSADVSPITINPGATYVILATAQGGPAGAVDLVFPQVESGTFAPGFYPADARYNGIRGQVYNQDAALTHVLKGYSGQPVNENAAGVDIAPGKVVQWMGNGNQSAPWLAIENDLAPNV